MMRKLKQSYYLHLLLVIVLIASSCQKVVNIDLNEASPGIIIEGSISDQTYSCSVRLSTTVNYDEPNTFPAVSGAVVTINDDIGNIATLVETVSGKYTAASFAGVPGRTYTLKVQSGGKVYSAISKMPKPVLIDSIYQGYFMLGSFSGGGMIKYVVVRYLDPAGIDNYYRFIEKINISEMNSIFLDNDLIRDGEEITQTIVRTEPSVQTGDSVRIFLQTIDKNVFNYLSQLRDITGGFSGPNAAPGNPVSNFDNGALGYFSAFAVRSRSIRIQ
jgi:hypothetical protein